MKKIFTLLFFVFIYHVGFSQVWENLDSVTAKVDRGAGFAIDDTGYIFGGNYFGNAGNMWGYDTLSNSWAHVTTYPSDSVDGVVACSLNGYGYAGTGGYCCYQFGNSFFKYVPNAATGGTWTRLPIFPGAGRAYGVGFALDGKVYIGGGLSGNGSTSNSYHDFYAYDPGKNTWSQIADCPATGVPCDAVAFVIGDTVYVGSGGKINSLNQSVPQNDFWKYDTTSKVWTQIASIPGNRAEAAAYANCDRGIVGLGYTDSTRNTDHADFWQYDPTKNRWIQAANFGGGPRNCPEAWVMGKNGYIVGGTTPTGFVHEDLWRYISSLTPAFSADTLICQGSSISFTDTSNYTSPYNRLWQFQGGKPDTSSAKNPVIRYDSTGVWNVTLTIWDDCDTGTQTFTKVITVTPYIGSVTVTPDSPSVCNGQSITLIANAGANATYQWVGANDTTDSIIVHPAKDTTYELIAGSGSCAKDTFITVTVNTPPPLIINPPTPAVECNGQPIIITVPASGSDYTWSPATGLSATTGSSVVADPTADITYTIMGIDSLGCMVEGTEAISIQFGPNKPTITVSVTGDTLFSSAKNGDQWYLNGTPVNGATDSLYVITGFPHGDSITVSVINVGNGCSTTSNLFVTGINQLSVINDQLSIYPNPTNSSINVTISSSVAGINNWSLLVTDVLGRTLYSKSSLNYKNEIDLSNLPGGVYFITVINKTSRAVIPVVKQQ